MKGVAGLPIPSFMIATGGKFAFNGATLNATGGMVGSPTLEYGFEVIRNGQAALVGDREATCNQSAELLTITKCEHGDGVVFHIEDGEKIGVCKYCNTVIDGGLGFGGFEIETLEGAPQIDSDNMEDVVSTLLTSEEYYDGFYILLLSSPYDADSVPADDRAALEAKAKELGASVGVWFDISLSKRNEFDESVNIPLHEVGQPVHLSVDVPESLRKDGRTFYLIRFHDGETAVIAQGTGNTLKGESDRFSTYAIAYTDGPAAAKAASSAPKTDDDLFGIVAVVAVIAVVAAFGIFIARRRLSSK